MSEFNDRIATQRRIIRIVNDGPWREELFGLSSGAIDRWERTNSYRVPPGLVELIREAAEMLFFLSNKSQEQITEEYIDLTDDISNLTDEIDSMVTSAIEHPHNSFDDT
jgi:hypothetical protein